MADNIITNADDVDVVLESEDGTKAGTPNAMGRVVASDFTITAEQDISSVGSIGHVTPAGLSKGDLEYSFSFTVSGEDVTVMDMVSDEVGDSIPFSLTARKTDENGNIVWEYSLTTCLADTEEITATTGETMELAVEGLAALLDKDV